jgi:glycine cleavage system transcriptional repressor
MAQLIITAVGPDRPGIVGELTAHLHAAGGNILDSRMVNLRGEFAMMILVELADASACARLADALPAQGQRMGLRVNVTPQEASAGKSQQGGLPYRLKTYSMDQPGIVARLSAVLRSLGVNIEELEARQESAPFAGSVLFSTEMRLTVPPGVPLGKLRAELEAVGNELNCDIDLDPGEA